MHNKMIQLLVWILCFACTASIDLGSRGGNRRRFDSNSNSGKTKVSVAVVLPHSMFKQRTYKKIIMQAALELGGSSFEDMYELSPYLEMVQPIPAPTEVLEKICDQFLANKTAAILYLTDSENYGRDSVASQYFMQLAQYVRLPMISWNADNSAFEQGSLQLQLAPTMKQQANAMLSLLDRYGWHTFSIVTGMIAGHRNFEQVIRELVAETDEDSEQKTIIDSVVVRDPAQDLVPVARTEARVFLMYSTKKEAIPIMEEAARLGLTGKAYVWIATQAVIGPNLDAPDEFPVGMLGVHFPTDRTSMISHIRPAMAIFGHALDSLLASTDLSDAEKKSVVQSNVSCHGRGEVRWNEGGTLFRFLRNVSVAQKDGGPPIEFMSDGSLRSVEMRIVNLQYDSDASSLDKDAIGSKKWEEIGVWQAGADQTDQDDEDQDSSATQSQTAFTSGRIDIKDIVWPGHALKPPEGIPEKRFIRVSFLEEDPYIMLGPPSTCAGNKGVICQKVDDSILVGVNMTEESKKDNSSMLACCSGFCVDLLLKFSADLSFDFQMTRVRDGKWGGVVNGKWNGLVAELLNHETDIVMTSLKINSGRERVIDFSVPFLETGITILVAKKTGIISPTAFLEPFDTASWMLVALVAIQVAAGCIFLFEWLSPSGYNMEVKHPQGRFSFLRTLWLVWAVLFQAAVNVDCPRGYTARFMAHIWATFALIFLAIYTANLAAFMITREEFPNLSGLEDKRLSNPRSHKPPFRFGTIPNGATDYVLKNNFPNTHEYMKKFSRESVKEGFKAVKGDYLDAFLYDATVLEYLVGQDDECNVLTVGSWYAMTGYGVAFPKGSMWIPKFNEYLMKYRENGDLERMQRFWFTGACEPRKRRRTSSKPLALAQFMSAFLLLGIGITLSGLLLFCEHCYFRYLRKHLAALGRAGWCTLISISVADSLAAVASENGGGNDEDQSSNKMLQQRTCHDPICELSISTVSRELESATKKIEALKRQLAQVDKEEEEEIISEPEHEVGLNREDTCSMTLSSSASQPRWAIQRPEYLNVVKQRGGCSHRVSEIETVL